MSAVKATRRPKGPKRRTAGERQIIRGIEAELAGLHRTNQLLIAIEFAADHECKFDVNDAIAVVNERMERHIEKLDRLCV